jgi:hypothetical protein
MIFVVKYKLYIFFGQIRENQQKPRNSVELRARKQQVSLTTTALHERLQYCPFSLHVFSVLSNHHFQFLRNTVMKRGKNLSSAVAQNYPAFRLIFRSLKCSSAYLHQRLRLY